MGTDDERKPSLPETTKPSKSVNPFTEEAPVMPPHLLEVYFLNVKIHIKGEEYLKAYRKGIRN